MVPALDQEMVLPWASVMVIMVLLNEAFTCATPEVMFLRSRFLTRASSLALDKAPYFFLPAFGFADLKPFLVGHLVDPARIFDAHLAHDFPRLGLADAMDVLQRDNDALVG